MGDSAGGNLAAVVALLARDAGGPEIRAQVLIYPGVEMYDKWPSEIRNAEAPVLTWVAGALLLGGALLALGAVALLAFGARWLSLASAERDR